MTNPTGALMRNVMVVAVLLAAAAVPARASDHADPIDIFNRVPLEGGITDLFVFPDRDSAELVFILCVRRALTDSGSLMLEPYTYTISMDLHSPVDFSDEEKRLRYGGAVVKPAEISADVEISFRLGDDAALVGKPAVRGLGDVGEIVVAPERRPTEVPQPPSDGRINVWSGVADDPFIFPVFFKTNVVAMVISIPRKYFPADQQDWIVWGSSSRDGRRVDHVGRSLRTQNPRFELLNTLHPRDHVAAITAEHEHPSLMRDLFLRIGLNSMFAYRKWDFVPDVMLYTRRHGGRAVFPNGRALSDDVAKVLADNGDTLLYEISFIAGGWPRATKNDNEEQQPNGSSTLPRAEFPYLANPWPDSPPRRPPTLTTANRLKLGAIALGAVTLWLVTAWLLAAWLDYRRRRQRYL